MAGEGLFPGERLTAKKGFEGSELAGQDLGNCESGLIVCGGVGKMDVRKSVRKIFDFQELFGVSEAFNNESLKRFFCGWKLNLKSVAEACFMCF